MNGVKKLTLIAAATGALLAQGTSVLASDGQVEFVGTITETGCTISDMSGGRMTLSMGEVARSSFKAVGDRSGAKRFQLNLTNCPPGKTVAVNFWGSMVPKKNLLATTGESKGVGIVVTSEVDQTTNLIAPFDGQQASYTVTPDASGTAQMTLMAFYERYGAGTTADPFTSGTAGSIANVDLTYK